MSKKIGIACDHAAYETKEFLVGYLSTKGYELFDYGTSSPESVDYADYGHQLATAIQEGEVEMGVALCGSGEGMAITLNRHKGVRAGLCWIAPIAKLTRQHNNANVVVLPARFIDNDQAVEIVDTFLNEEFEGGRHQARIEKIEL